MDAAPPKADASLDGVTVLLTRASGTIGRALSAHFARRGARLMLTGRDAQRLEELARALDGESMPVSWMQADLTDAASLEALAAEVARVFPRLDVLINNAADVTSNPLMESSLEDIDRQIRANVTGTLQLCRLLVPHMEEGWRSIVNVSSLAGYKPNPAQTVYSVSKAGMNAISEALNAELGARGFRVLNVALMGVGEGPGRISAARYAQRLERAILRRDHELFLYRRTKWLMRLYRAFPGLARRRAD